MSFFSFNFYIELMPGTSDRVGQLSIVVALGHVGPNCAYCATPVAEKDKDILKN